MESTRKALDLFCGVGGTTKGLQLAGFHVTGIDHTPQPDYCGDRFIQADIMSLMDMDFSEYDYIFAGPPCQADCMLTAGTNQGRVYPNHTDATRAILQRSGRPYVIENPPGRTSLRRDLVLCGEMFELGVMRHRVFEFGNGAKFTRKSHIPHRGRVNGWRHGIFYPGPYYAVYGEGGGKGSVAEWRIAMGINWTWERKSIAEAIPPAYSQYIGEVWQMNDAVHA